MFDPFEIERRIQTAIPNSKIDVLDLTGGGDHFKVKVVSVLFEGKSRIEQHRMIYSALGDAMDSAIHALQIETATK
jgi:stress-induced morphogen